MSDLFTSPSTATPNTIARSNQLNNLIAATAAAFNKLPNELEIKQDRFAFAANGGTGTNMTLALPYAPASYVDGLKATFRSTVGLGGTGCTLNVNGLGPKAVKRLDGSDPQAGDISIGKCYIAIYSSADDVFYIQNTSVLLTFWHGSTGGASNTAYGTSALNAIAGGTGNTAFGYRALNNDTGGNSNTAVGVDALYSITNSGGCTAFGLGALINCNAGSNTAVGYQAGQTITTGTSNTFCGIQADSSSNAGVNRSAFGNGAIATADNQVMLGNTSVTEVKSSGKFTAGMGSGSGTTTLQGVSNANSTAAGNVGAGLTDLMSYAIPANSMNGNNKGVEVEAWGTAANNAAAKTLKLFFGSTAFTISLTTNQALSWRIKATILRSGANTQVATVEIRSGTTTTAVDNYLNSASMAETDTAIITVKCTGQATSNNDIVQTGMVVKYIG